MFKRGGRERSMIGMSVVSQGAEDVLGYPELVYLGVCEYPLAMVDRITGFINGKRPVLKGLKNVSINEPHFRGHFKNYPVMPGNLIAECLGQLSGYLHSFLKFSEILEKERGLSVDNGTILFPAILQNLKKVSCLRTSYRGGLASHNVKYRRPVFPGDQLLLQTQLVLQDRGFFHHTVEANVGGMLVASGTIVNFFITPPEVSSAESEINIYGIFKSLSDIKDSS